MERDTARAFAVLLAVQKYNEEENGFNLVFLLNYYLTQMKAASSVKFVFSEFKGFLGFLKIYLKDKIIISSALFEGSKNVVVKNVLIKRGKRNRLFLHASAMALLTLGVIVSPFIADSNPFSPQNNKSNVLEGNSETSYLASIDVFQTQISNVRDEIITYEVQKGDTISTIAKKFAVSEDTIKWANNLINDNITVGDELQILPTTGIAHKVAQGDTVYSIAKKYQINAQGIVDFPFNDFANPQTFSLVTGQIVIVPNGIKPSEQAQPQYARQTYIATGPTTLSDSGFTWPLRGEISQFFSWYHKAVDILSPIGTPIVSSTNGNVAGVFVGGWNGGYGTHIIIQGDNGYQTLYAHMSAVNVSTGQTVSAGKTIIGWVGMTGRTTGAHVHFEVRGNGDIFNPMAFLR